MAGAIKIPRDIQGWGWFDDPNTMYCFIRLVMMANWESRIWHGMAIERGQFVTSLASLSADLNLSQRQTRTCLERITNDKLADIQTTNKWTKITICNYDSYQLNALTERQANDKQRIKQATRQMSNKRQQEEEQEEQEEHRKSIADAIPESDGITPRKVVELWNQICSRCSKVVGLSETRAEKVRCRLDQMSGDKEATIRNLFAKINASDFLCLGSGSGEHKNWRVTFDWVFKNDTNWLKVLEGKFDNDANGLFPGEVEWRIKDKAYSKSDFEKHQDEYNALEAPLKNRLVMGHKIVWTGTYWKRDDFVL